MSSKSRLKTDTNVLGFMAAMPSASRKDLKLVMYDTEPTPFGADRGPVVFDMAFQSFNPFGTSKGKPGGGLVYEVIRSREIMGHLMDQNKLNKAAADDYYYVTNMLSKDGPHGESWFSDKIDEIPNYGQRTREAFLERIQEHLIELNNYYNPGSVMLVNEKNQNDVYLSIIEHLKVNRESVAYFKGQATQVEAERVREGKAVRRADSIKTLLDVYADYITKTTTNRDALREVMYLNQNMRTEVLAIRNAYFKSMLTDARLGKNLDYESDLQVLKGLAKKGVAGATDVKKLNDIITEFKTMYNSDGVVGMMGHNVVKDLDWTRKTIQLVDGVSTSEQEHFDQAKIQAFCSQQLISRLTSLEGTELVHTFLGLNDGEMYDKFKNLADNKGLPSLAQGKGKMTLEVLYNNIVSKEEQTPQTHTGRGDVDWTIAVVQHYMREVTEFFEKGK